MKRYSFGTFLVDESNREAFQVCQDIAELRPVAPQPVLLLGDARSGKTHLLYSIVNRIKSASADVRFAYVTAQDFPPPVRALIKDPRPVQGGKPAILLVDQLEQFTQYTEELEAVVRIFLDNGHCIALTSNVHPGRLRNLTEGLRALLEQGRIVPIASEAGEGNLEALKRQIRRDYEALLEKQQEENAALRAQLSQRSSGDGDDVPDMRKTIDDLRTEVNELRSQAQVTKALNDSLTREIDAARDQLEDARRELSLRAVSEPSLGDAHFDQLREQLSSAQEEILRLREALDARAAVESTAADLHAELDALRAEKARLEEERSALEGSLEALRQQMSERDEAARAMREELAQARADLVEEHARATQEMEQLRAEIRRHTEERLADEEQRAQLIIEKQHFENDLQAVREQLDAVIRAHQDEQVEHEHRRRAIEEENEAVRQRMVEELERVRQEAETTRRTLEEERLNARARLDEAQREIQSLRDQADRISHFEVEHQRATHEVQAAREDVQRLQAEVEKLQEDARQAREEAESLKAAQRHFDEEAERLRSANASVNEELERAWDENRKSREELQTLVERAGRMVEQIEANRARFAETEADQRRRIEELERHLEGYAAAVAASQELDAVRAQAQEAQAQLEMLRASFEQERQSLQESIRESREKLLAELAAAHDLTAKVEQERNTALEASQQLTEALARKEEERSSLQSALEGVLHDREALQASLQETAASRDTLQAALDQAQAEREALQAQLAGVEATKSELETTVAGLRETVRTQALELEELQERAATQQQAAERMAHEINRLQSRLMVLRQDHASVAAELLETGRTMAAAEQALARLADRLASHEDFDAPESPPTTSHAMALSIDDSPQEEGDEETLSYEEPAVSAEVSFSSDEDDSSEDGEGEEEYGVFDGGATAPIEGSNSPIEEALPHREHRPEDAGAVDAAGHGEAAWAEEPPLSPGGEQHLPSDAEEDVFIPHEASVVTGPEMGVLAPLDENDGLLLQEPPDSEAVADDDRDPFIRPQEP